MKAGEGVAGTQKCTERNRVLPERPINVCQASLLNSPAALNKKKIRNEAYMRWIRMTNCQPVDLVHRQTDRQTYFIDPSWEIAAWDQLRWFRSHRCLANIRSWNSAAAVSFHVCSTAAEVLLDQVLQC